MNLNSLLNFDHCSDVTAIEKRFLEISKALFTNYLIFNKKTNKYYAAHSIELFNNYPKANAPDPFIHKHSQQESSGKWYVHQKGEKENLTTRKRSAVSITCGKQNEYHASIVIRSVLEVNCPKNKTTTSDFNARNAIYKDGIARVLQLIAWNNSNNVPAKWSAEEKDELFSINNESIFDSNSIIHLFPNNNEQLFNCEITPYQIEKISVLEDEAKKNKKKKIERKLNLKKEEIKNKARNYKYLASFSFPS